MSGEFIANEINGLSIYKKLLVVVSIKEKEMSEVALLPCLFGKHNPMPRTNRVKTLIMKKSSKTCPICIEGFK